MKARNGVVEREERKLKTGVRIGWWWWWCGVVRMATALLTLAPPWHGVRGASPLVPGWMRCGVRPAEPWACAGRGGRCTRGGACRVGVSRRHGYTEWVGRSCAGQGLARASAVESGCHRRVTYRQ